MRFSSVLVILVLAGAAVLAAGCTQAAAPVQPAAPGPAEVPDLHVLALAGSDMPACFSLTAEGDKQSADVGNLAMELGWQAGYAVTWTCPAEGKEPMVVVHSLAVYPAANIPGIASVVNKQDRPAGYTYEDLSIPDRNATISGFYGTTGDAPAYDLAASTDILTGRGNRAGTATVTGSDVGQIVVYRGNVFEVVRMSGPGTNATVLTDLARRAAAKIP